MTINSIADYRRAVLTGPYAWPGGYPLFAVMDDGEAMCWDCFVKERRRILESLRDNSRDGWKPAGIEINYEDSNCYCCHCNKLIESAYGEDPQ